MGVPSGLAGGALRRNVDEAEAEEDLELETEDRGIEGGSVTVGIGLCQRGRKGR